MFNQKDLTELIKDVTLRLPQTEPFFFVIPLEVMEQAKYVKDVHPSGTACVTPERAIFCDAFMDKLTAPKRRGVILHEILHPALGHLSDPYIDQTLTRQQFHDLANRAQDFVIENLINEMAQAESPSLPAEKRPLAGYYPVDANLLRFKGMSWRQVYEILREERAAGKGEGKGEGGSGSGETNLDEHVRGDAQGEADIWEAAREESGKIAESLLQQAGAERGAGSILIEVAKPVLAWKDMLKDYLTSLPAPVRKTWARVDRRTFCAYQQYAPTMTGSVEALGHVYLMVDTSGSMYEWLPVAAADILNLFKQLEVGSVTLVYYDVGIQAQEELEHADLDDYTITSMPGGGGTCINLALEELSRDTDFDKDAPIVVLTDGYDSYQVGNLELGPLVWVSYAAPVVSDKGISVTVPK